MSEPTLLIPTRFYFYPCPDLQRRRELARRRLVMDGKNVDAEPRARLRRVK
jgi:hypothetical protein